MAKGEILFRLFCLLFFPAGLWAQVITHYSSPNLELDFAENRLTGSLNILVQNSTPDTIKSLHWAFWGNAYQRNGTALGKELLEDQNMGLHFANNEDLGYFERLNFVMDDEIFAISDEEFFTIQVKIPPGQSITFSADMSLKLPHSRFNGFGFSNHTIRLSHTLPQLLMHGSQTANSRNREAAFVPATYDLSFYLKNRPSNILLVSNLDGFEVNNCWVLTSAEPVADLLLLVGLMAKVEGGRDELGTRTLFIENKTPFPAYNGNITWEKVNTFFKQEFDIELNEDYSLIYLNNKKGLQSVGKVLLLSTSQNTDDVEGEIIEELVAVLARERLNVNPEKHPWMVAGMANYYKHLYFQRYYPDKKLLGPVAKTRVAKVMDVDHYPINQQNRMTYLYMVRQGLDQPLSDTAGAFVRANYEAIVKGKGSMAFAYLRSYVGEKNYLRSMRRWLADTTAQGTPEVFIGHLQYYHNRDVSWFMQDFYSTTKKFDYAMVKAKACKSVATATVKNKGKIMAPYSITGVKNGSGLLTEWFMPHEGKKTVQIHFEDYKEIKLDAQGAMPEYSQKNNVVRTSGLFKQMQPLKLQFYNSFENPQRTQIFWLPSVKFNAYDRVLLGVQFYNQSLFLKPFEYRISPDFSTGTGKLTGLAQFRYNYTPSQGPFHLIQAGLYGRYFHYAPDLAYTRISPALTFHFRKKYPRQEVLRSLRIRAVAVNREEPDPDSDVELNIKGPPRYQVLDIRFLEERTSVLHPTISIVDVRLAEQFVKLSLDLKQRLQLSRNHLLTVRVFAGAFANRVNNLDDFFLFGLSGTQDYIFDLPLIGRSDVSGIWSQQFFVTDGGFKSQSSAFFTDIQSINVNLPIYRFTGFYWGMAHSFGASPGYINYEYGLYLELIPDFFEIYFPIQNNFNSFINQSNYLSNVRFVLNVDLNAIVTRARRGFY